MPPNDDLSSGIKPDNKATNFKQLNVKPPQAIDKQDVGVIESAA